MNTQTNNDHTQTQTVKKYKCKAVAGLIFDVISCSPSSMRDAVIIYFSFVLNFHEPCSLRYLLTLFMMQSRRLVASFYMSHASVIFFSTAIWVSHSQLWVILKGIASLTQCCSLRFDLFRPKGQWEPRGWVSI